METRKKKDLHWRGEFLAALVMAASVHHQPVVIKSGLEWRVASEERAGPVAQRPRVPIRGRRDDEGGIEA